MSIDRNGARVKPRGRRAAADDGGEPTSSPPSLADKIERARGILRERRHDAPAVPAGGRVGRGRALDNADRVVGAPSGYPDPIARPRPRDELAGLVPLDKVLAQLRALDLDYEPTDSGFTSRCPRHRGSKRNFEVTVADDGRVLLCCHAYHDLNGDDACTQEAVVEALGLKMADLFPGGGHGDGRQQGTRRQSIRDTVSRPTPTAEELARWGAESDKAIGIWRSTRIARYRHC